MTIKASNLEEASKLVTDLRELQTFVGGLGPLDKTGEKHWLITCSFGSYKVNLQGDEEFRKLLLRRQNAIVNRLNELGVEIDT